jgi:hypothetical protein
MASNTARDFYWAQEGLVGGVAVGNVLPFCALPSPHLRQNRFYVVMAELPPPQGGWYPTVRCYGHSSLQLPDVYLSLYSLAVSALFWNEYQRICPSVLTMFGSEVVSLEALDPASRLFLETPETHQPG